MLWPQKIQRQHRKTRQKQATRDTPDTNRQHQTTKQRQANRQEGSWGGGRLSGGSEEEASVRHIFCATRCRRRIQKLWKDTKGQGRRLTALVPPQRPQSLSKPDLFRRPSWRRACGTRAPAPRPPKELLPIRFCWQLTGRF